MCVCVGVGEDHKKRKKYKTEELRSGCVSTSAGKQISSLALDSLPISHKITSFPLLPEGPLRPPAHKGCRRIPGTCGGKRALSQHGLICNAFLRHNFLALRPHKDISVPICDFNNFYFLHCAFIMHPPIMGSGWAQPQAWGMSDPLQGPGLENRSVDSLASSLRVSKRR